MKNTEALVSERINEGLLSHIAIRVGRKEQILGEVYSENVDSKTMFDMASVTKIMVTTMIALIAMGNGKLKPEDAISRYYPVPDHKEGLTIRHLLTHTMGIGHRDLTKSAGNYNNIADHILALSGNAIGEDVAYSCPAFILLGKILEKIYGKRLDDLFEEMIAAPLGLKRSRFEPYKTNEQNIVNSNLTPEEKGMVNDYNCRYLGGVAGNAGLFSCVEDVDAFVKCLLHNGSPLFPKAVLDTACQNHTPDMSDARGLGFLYVDNRYRQTGKLFPEGSIGHCGHTGQSVFLNRESGLYVMILSDATISTVKKYGKEDYQKVKDMRKELHNAIKQDLTERG